LSDLSSKVRRRRRKRWSEEVDGKPQKNRNGSEMGVNHKR